MEINKNVIKEFVKQELDCYRENTRNQEKDYLYHAYHEIYVTEEIARYFDSLDFEINGWERSAETNLYLHLLYRLGNQRSILFTLYKWYLRDEYAEVYCFDEIRKFIESYCENRLSRSKQVPEGEKRSLYVYSAQIPCDCGHCVDSGINDYFEKGVFFSSLREMKQAFERADLDVTGDTPQKLQEELEDICHRPIYNWLYGTPSRILMNITLVAISKATIKRQKESLQCCLDLYQKMKSGTRKANEGIIFAI